MIRLILGSILLSILFLAGTTCGAALGSDSAPLEPRDASETTNACKTLPLPLNFISSDSSFQTRGDNGTDESSEWDTTTSDFTLTPRKRRRSGTPQETWTATVEKGKNLWKQLQESLTNQEAQDAEVCQLGDRWSLDRSPGSLSTLNYKWDFLPEEAIPFPQPIKSFFNVNITAPLPPGEAEYAYANSYSPKYGVINVVSTKGVDEQGSRAPDRWSDVTWVLWSQLCARDGKDPADLKWILRDTIVNKRTQDIMDEVIVREYGQEEAIVYKEHHVFFYSTTDEFDALLTTPNVVGVVYMLIRNVNATGRKTIRGIGVFRERPGTNYSIYIELKKAPPVRDTVATS